MWVVGLGGRGFVDDQGVQREMEAAARDKANVFRDGRARRSHLPTGRRLRQENCCKFQVSLSDMKSCPKLDE